MFGAKVGVEVFVFIMFFVVVHVPLQAANCTFQEIIGDGNPQVISR